MKFDRLIFGLTILLVFMMASRISIDSDTWWHLRAGKWMVEHRQIITSDPFSYTRFGSAWRYPGWIVEIPMYGITKMVGLGGLNILTALVIAASFGMIYSASNGTPLLRAFVVIFAATASGIYWSARPHLLTILFSALFIFILEKIDKTNNPQSMTRWILFLPIIILIWVNGHGGFVMGFILIGGYILGALMDLIGAKLLPNQKHTFDMNKIRLLIIGGFGMLIAGVINPLGYEIYLYPIKTVAIDSLRTYIQEWQSPDFHSLSVQPFLWLFILLIASVGLSHNRMSGRELIITSILLYLSLTAGRNIALFALYAPVVITRHLNELIGNCTRLGRGGEQPVVPNPSENYKLAINGVLFGLVFIGVVIKVAYVFPEPVNQQYIKTLFPVGAVNYIQRNIPEGHIFNSYNWGGYLLWALPEYPVFVDGRTDLYNDEIIQDWLTVAQFKTGWEQVLNNWRIDYILMESNWLPSKLIKYSGWCTVYEDEISQLLRRCPKETE
jgi:hypothetical protein